MRLAESIGTNPVVVRRIAGQLSRAGLISVQRGPGGATLARPASAITMRDVWRAIHPAHESMVRVHDGTNPSCPIGRQVPALLRARLDAAEETMLDDLARTSLAELLSQTRNAPTPAEG